MTPSDWVSGLAAALVVTVVVASGPLAGGILAPGGTPTVVGDGNATVASVDVPTDDLVVTPGRFGTDVAYLRVPDARVDLAAVTDRPRLVYRVEVPALDADLTATEIITGEGTYRLHHDDYGLSRSALSGGSYEGTVTVHLQSFTTDRTLYSENVTVEVRR